MPEGISVTTQTTSQLCNLTDDVFEAVRQHEGRKSYLLGARDMCHDVQDVYDRRSPYVRNILNDGRLWDEVAQSFNHDLNENESDKMKMKANKRHVPVGARTRVPMPWLPDNETLMQARTLKELAAGPDFSGVSEALPPLELGQLPVCPILQSFVHISCICCSAAAGRWQCSSRQCGSTATSSAAVQQPAVRQHSSRQRSSAAASSTAARQPAASSRQPAASSTAAGSTAAGSAAAGSRQHGSRQPAARQLAASSAAAGSAGALAGRPTDAKRRNVSQYAITLPCGGIILPYPL